MLSTQSFSSFLERVVVVVVVVSLLSEEFEREREGIYFFPFFSKEKKAQKRTIWRNTFKMRSLFFFPSPTFPRGGDENREMERKNDETREWRW